MVSNLQFNDNFCGDTFEGYICKYFLLLKVNFPQWWRWEKIFNKRFNTKLFWLKILEKLSWGVLKTFALCGFFFNHLLTVSKQPSFQKLMIVLAEKEFRVHGSKVCMRIPIIPFSYKFIYSSVYIYYLLNSEM